MTTPNDTAGADEERNSSSSYNSVASGQAQVVEEEQQASKEPASISRQDSFKSTTEIDHPNIQPTASRQDQHQQTQAEMELSVFYLIDALNQLKLLLMMHWFKYLEPDHRLCNNEMEQQKCLLSINIPPLRIAQASTLSIEEINVGLRKLVQWLAEFVSNTKYVPIICRTLLEVYETTKQDFGSSGGEKRKTKPIEIDYHVSIDMMLLKALHNILYDPEIYTADNSAFLQVNVLESDRIYFERMCEICFNFMDPSCHTALVQQASNCLILLSRWCLPHIVSLYTDFMAKIKYKSQFLNFSVYQQTSGKLRFTVQSVQQINATIAYLEGEEQLMRRISYKELIHTTCDALSSALLSLVIHDQRESWTLLCRDELLSTRVEAVLEAIYVIASKWSRKYPNFAYKLMLSVVCLSNKQEVSSSRHDALINSMIFRLSKKDQGARVSSLEHLRSYMHGVPLDLVRKHQTEFQQRYMRLFASLFPPKHIPRAQEAAELIDVVVEMSKHDPAFVLSHYVVTVLNAEWFSSAQRQVMLAVLSQLAFRDPVVVRARAELHLAVQKYMSRDQPTAVVLCAIHCFPALCSDNDEVLRRIVECATDSFDKEIQEAGRSSLLKYIEEDIGMRALKVLRLCVGSPCLSLSTALAIKTDQIRSGIDTLQHVMRVVNRQRSDELTTTVNQAAEIIETWCLLYFLHPSSDVHRSAFKLSRYLPTHSALYMLKAVPDRIVQVVLRPENREALSKPIQNARDCLVEQLMQGRVAGGNCGGVAAYELACKVSPDDGYSNPLALWRNQCDFVCASFVKTASSSSFIQSLLKECLSSPSPVVSFAIDSLESLTDMHCLKVANECIPASESIDQCLNERLIRILSALAKDCTHPIIFERVVEVVSAWILADQQVFKAAIATWPRPSTFRSAASLLNIYIKKTYGDSNSQEFKSRKEIFYIIYNLIQQYPEMGLAICESLVNLLDRGPLQFHDIEMNSFELLRLFSSYPISLEYSRKGLRSLLRHNSHMLLLYVRASCDLPMFDTILKNNNVDLRSIESSSEPRGRRSSSVNISSDSFDVPIIEPDVELANPVFHLLCLQAILDCFSENSEWGTACLDLLRKLATRGACDPLANVLTSIFVLLLHQDNQVRQAAGEIACVLSHCELAVVDHECSLPSAIYNPCCTKDESALRYSASLSNNNNLITLLPDLLLAVYEKIHHCDQHKSFKLLTLLQPWTKNFYRFIHLFQADEDLIHSIFNLLLKICLKALDDLGDLEASNIMYNTTNLSIKLWINFVCIDSKEDCILILNNLCDYFVYILSSNIAIISNSDSEVDVYAANKTVEFCCNTFREVAQNISIVKDKSILLDNLFKHIRLIEAKPLEQLLSQSQSQSINLSLASPTKRDPSDNLTLKENAVLCLVGSTTLFLQLNSKQSNVIESIVLLIHLSLTYKTLFASSQRVVSGIIETLIITQSEINHQQRTHAIHLCNALFEFNVKDSHSISYIMKELFAVLSFCFNPLELHRHWSAIALNRGLYSSNYPHQIKSLEVLCVLLSMNLEPNIGAANNAVVSDDGASVVDGTVDDDGATDDESLKIYDEELMSPISSPLESASEALKLKCQRLLPQNCLFRIACSICTDLQSNGSDISDRLIWLLNLLKLIVKEYTIPYGQESFQSAVNVITSVCGTLLSLPLLSPDPIVHIRQGALKVIKTTLEGLSNSSSDNKGEMIGCILLTLNDSISPNALTDAVCCCEHYMCADASFILWLMNVKSIGGAQLSRYRFFVTVLCEAVLALVFDETSATTRVLSAATIKYNNSLKNSLQTINMLVQLQGASDTKEEESLAFGKCLLEIHQLVNKFINGAVSRVDFMNQFSDSFILFCPSGCIEMIVKMLKTGSYKWNHSLLGLLASFIERKVFNHCNREFFEDLIDVLVQLYNESKPDTDAFNQINHIMKLITSNKWTSEPPERFFFSFLQSSNEAQMINEAVLEQGKRVCYSALLERLSSILSS